MNTRERFRRRGPLVEIAPGCWICVAGVTAVLRADDGDGADGLSVVEADGRPYVVRPVPAVVAQAVAEAMLDWARDRAQAEEEGRLLALDTPGGLPTRRRPTSYGAGRRRLTDRRRRYGRRPPRQTGKLDAHDRQLARRDRQGRWSLRLHDVEHLGGGGGGRLVDLGLLGPFPGGAPWRTPPAP